MARVWLKDLPKVLQQQHTATGHQVIGIRSHGVQRGLVVPQLLSASLP